MRTAEFHPAALKTIRSFSQGVKRSIGQAILELQKGGKLSMPLSRPVKSVGTGAAEIRIKDSAGIYRVFYLVKMRGRIIIFHAFIKKTQKTPRKEIKKAQQQLKEILYGD